MSIGFRLGTRARYRAAVAFWGATAATFCRVQGRVIAQIRTSQAWLARPTFKFQMTFFGSAEEFADAQSFPPWRHCEVQLRSQMH